MNMFLGPIKQDTAAILNQFAKLQNLEVLSFTWTIRKFMCMELDQNSVCDWAGQQLHFGRCHKYIHWNNWEGI